jgi:hypothetical protein
MKKLAALVVGIWPGNTTLYVKETSVESGPALTFAAIGN